MPFTDNVKTVNVLMTEQENLTAKPEDVVINKTYIGANNEISTGTLPVIERQGDVVLLAGESHTMPYGKNPFPYTVKSQDLDIQTEGDAISEEIVEGKIAWVNGEKIIGSMHENESEEIKLLCDESYDIPAGYHDGNGKVIARSLEEQTYGNAIPSHLTKGMLAWVNGEQITGIMEDRKGMTAELNCGETFSILEGYHNGEGFVKAKNLSTQTPGDAKPEDLLDGKEAWVNGGKIIGSMIKVPSATKVFSLNETYYIPQGYHTGAGKLIQNIPTKDGFNVGPAKDPQTLDVAGHYMNGNITVTGIDALNYKRPNSGVKDISGNYINNYPIPVLDDKGIIQIYVDNWHDNATMNIYRLRFNNLINYSNEPMDLDCIVYIDWGNPQNVVYKFGEIEITITPDSETNAQTLEINYIKSGILTITELFSSRQFGVD